uniref:CUB domain-containing protein n=1 Tax=Lepisosteus oculatus TaxID=7918 RepID=W5M194_LEPOC
MAACSGKVEQHTERRGVIYSPSWPLNYPAGMNCSWNIQGDKGDVITISFRNFDLEESGKCAGDWLLLGPTWREEYRVCGSLIPPPFISTRGHVWLHFHSASASSGQAQGFRLSYIRGECREIPQTRPRLFRWLCEETRLRSGLRTAEIIQSLFSFLRLGVTAADSKAAATTAELSE